ncbi:MAG: aspartate aminotransferase family protein [Lachnospiraceae bacterium]|nr:aspartate aminotransferase family protein [Lachnospiraceae bacterium]
MDMNNIIETAEENILHTYNRYNIVLDHGDGVHVYDTAGKCYLDFYSGIGVYGLGNSNKEFNEALKNQIDKILHVSNLFYNEPAAKAADALVKVSGMDKVFFTNSGAEAIEGALKAALKYAYNKDGKHDHEIIALDHSFHGRTCGALAVTGKAAYREAFEPLISKVNFATMNDYDSVISLVNDKTCAIIMETVQGEGGVYPAEKDFLQKVYKLCNEKDILLILDEVQCGMGRCGSMYAFMQYDVYPDILTSAKALGNGVPVGAFLVNKKVAGSSLAAGDHGTTYGGNPFAAAAVCEVLRQYEKLDIVAHVKELTPYLEGRLDELVNKYDCITSRRGLGFMQGLELSIAPSEVINAGIEKGILTLSAGSNVLRLLPPLIITDKDVDNMYNILDDVFAHI